MKKFAKWLVMILVVSCICALTLFATGCGNKDKSVKSVTVNDKGEIVAVYDDNTTATLGKVGLIKSAEMKDGKFVLTLTDGKTVECAVAATAKTVVSIKTVGNELEITYSTGDVEKISLGASVTCEHKDLIYKEQVAHKMNADGKTFTNGIYLELCPDCGYAKTVTGVHHDFEDKKVAPTCLEKGYTAHECKVCKYVGDKTDYVDALGHKFVKKPLLPSNAKDWCVNGGYTVERCAVCDAKSDKPSYFLEEGIGHKSAAWTLITAEERDAAAPGVLEGKCDNCETLVRENLPAYMDEKGNVIGEDYKLVKIERASCGEAGKAELTITIDNQTFTLKNVKTPKGNHTLNGKILDVEKDGVDGVLTFDDDAAFTASKLSLFADKDLSCKESVPAQFTCEVCQKQVLVNVQKKHTQPANKDDIKVVKEATCEEEGILEYTCKVCCTGEAKVTEKVKKLGHDFEYRVDDPSVTKDGTYSIYWTCKRKGCDKADSLTNLKDVVKKVIKEASCKEDGTVRYEYRDAAGVPKTITQTVAKLAHTLLKDGAKVEMPTKENNVTKVYAYNDFKNVEGMTWFIEGTPTCKENINGSFKCASCEKDVLVTFSIPHTRPADVTYNVDKATCEVAKQTNPYTCTVCKKEGLVDIIEPALEHIFVYKADNENKIIVTCARQDCNYTRHITFASKPVYNVVVPATCEKEGSATYTGIVDGQEKVVPVKVSKAPHETAHGAKYYSLDIAPSTDADISLFVDQASGCGSEPAMGQFVCKTCTKNVLVKVKAPHKKPATFAEGKEQKPTCTVSGWIKYDCDSCGTKGIFETVDPVGHDLTATVVGDKVVISCKTEKCSLHTTPLKKPLEAWETKVDGKNYYTEIAHKDADCGSDGYVRYSFTYTYTYTKTWINEQGATTKSEEVKVEFKNLIADKVIDATGHVNFVMEEKKGEDGNIVIGANGKPEMIVKIFTEEIERTIEGKKVVYIVKYKKCAECGAYILDGEPTVKPEEDTSAAA